jgi:hypothetical protein
MGFFKRDVAPVERFERALKDKLAARARLAEQLSEAEQLLAEMRAAAEQLAVAGASNTKLERAEVKLRAVEDRAKKLRAELAELDQQIMATERAWGDAKIQRDRDVTADGIEAMVMAIEQAAPKFEAGARSLMEAVTKSGAPVPDASRFATSVEAVRREVLSAVELLCWELRSTAVRTRAGNANVALLTQAEPEQPQQFPEIERQVIYTLNPLRWREGGELRKAQAFTLVDLPRMLLTTALRHQHVDYPNARRVQTLMQVHGGDRLRSELEDDDPLLVDLDVLAAEDSESPRADVA